jgi:uncharacterized membrane protein
MPRFLLAGLITAYAIYFSVYTINRHNTLHSYTADLSLIDQPIWNTVIGPGGFMELTWGSQQQPRLAEHFEPILVPLALLFYLWDDVRIQLIAQSIALALGAIPVYWITKAQLTINNEQLTNQTSNPAALRSGDYSLQSLFSNLSSWAGLAFAAVYLFYPHLQAANIADFHADPFVVTPLLLAFWYATQKRWGWMWFWALVVMATKETLPTLAAMLGIWLIATADRQWLTVKTPLGNSAVNGQWSVVIHGFGLILVGAAWFLIATFFIVAPLARQYFGTDGPIYLVNRYAGETYWLDMLLEPARWQYLAGLLAATGFLPLLAPELLLLGLPVLLANFFSNFPGQYSGEQHYSAPLVAVFILAAIYGVRRLIKKAPSRQINHQNAKVTTLIAALLWLLTWSLAYHAFHGWTPFSIRTEIYAMTSAAARLPDMAARIPPQAVVSASAALHPHLAHRQVIYTFPTIQEAEYLLVDVTDIPGVHPNDARARLLDLLNHEWQILEADQGLILAQKSSAASPADSPLPCLYLSPEKEDAFLPPCSFYDFARTAAAPSTPAQLSFGDDRLRLLGYDVHDDPDNGVTFRFYWQTSAPLPEDLHLWPLIYDDWGRLLNDPAQVPMIATVWYPPQRWQPGETIVTTSLPQLLPDTFHLGLAVGPAGSLTEPGRRWPVTQANQAIAGHWAQLASFKRQGPFLTGLMPIPTFQPLTPAYVAFGPTIQLTGYWFDQAAKPGQTLPVLLQWQADSPPPADYTVFIHLLAADGARVAQSDVYPTWLTAQPTSQWPPGQPILDSHQLVLPLNLPLGAYTLQVGLYNNQTLARLPLANGPDALVLGQVAVK